MSSFMISLLPAQILVTRARARHVLRGTHSCSRTSVQLHASVDDIVRSRQTTTSPWPHPPR